MRGPLTGVPLTRHRISTLASETLYEWLDGLAAGTLLLQQLPEVIAALYDFAYREGRASMAPELHAAKLEADRQWLLNFAPKDRQDYLLSRLDRAAEIMSDAGRIDDHMDAAWSLYCASLEDVRNPVVPIHGTPTTPHKNQSQDKEEKGYAA